MDQTVMKNPVKELLARRDGGKRGGIYSCCSANEYVIRAALRRAKEKNTVVLVEATANQVNQEGGYTGMTPLDFRNFLDYLAEMEGISSDLVFCGGDHLGPLTWKNLREEEAMPKAEALVRSFVLAGFSKIHIDTSMRLADDDAERQLAVETIARRGAILCAAAEDAYAEYRTAHPEAPAPVYVIGSEVPVPGGALENESAVTVTEPGECRAALAAFFEAFSRCGLGEMWNRIIALVVQPGVEFCDENVIEYDRTAAGCLTAVLKDWPGMVFEGHSTDYQPRERLKEMVEDGIAILKVGPALTFALREGLYALEGIEKEVSARHSFRVSGFRETLEEAMLRDDKYWKDYYHGRKADQFYARAFSFSDRARYYLTDPKVDAAVKALLKNLDREGIPMALLSQYLPIQYRRVRSGQTGLKAEDILIDHVGDWIDDYLYATLV